MPSEGKPALKRFGWLLDHPDRLGHEDRGVGGWLVGAVVGALLPASLDLQPGVGGAGDQVAADGDAQGGGVGRAAADRKAGQQVAATAAMLGVTKPSSRIRTPARVWWAS